jgi:peptidoglycan/LPS O-acetylase OafA/YrhL
MSNQMQFNPSIVQKLNFLRLVPNKTASKTWLSSLDGLRAIAVLLVLLEHITGNVFRDDSVGNGAFFASFLNFGDAGMGRSGVYLFFVLSSFLLTSQLLRAGMNFKDSKLWINYGFKRLIRIYPLYLFILLVYLTFPSFQYSLKDVFEHLILQKAGNHFWTIPVEIKYYLILPGIVWLITKILKHNIVHITVLLAVFSVLSKFLELTIWSPDRLSILPHLPIFLIGSLAAIVHINLINLPENIKCDIKLGMEAISIGSVLIIFLTLKTVPTYFLWELLIGYEMPSFPSNHWLYLLHGFLWATFLVSHLHGKGQMSSLLSWTPLRYIGVISFGIYLWHIAILGYFNAHLIMPSILKFLVILAITVFVSSVTYVLIEQPLMQLKLPFLQKTVKSTKQ